MMRRMLPVGARSSTRRKREDEVADVAAVTGTIQRDPGEWLGVADVAAPTGNFQRAVAVSG
jgi:hypothetical protein